MKASKLVALTLIINLVSCRPDKQCSFADSVKEITKIKTPFKLVDAKPIANIVSNKQADPDSFFIKQGFIPYGLIKEDKKFYSLILFQPTIIKPNIVNEMYLSTFNLQGKIIDTLKFNQGWRQLNDTSKIYSTFVIQNPDTIIQVDSVIEISKHRLDDGQVTDIIINIWKQKAITIDSRGKINK